jgi:hypothetical protein
MQRLSLTKCISPPCYELDADFSPLLVMHESRLYMQACASQIDKEHYNMLKMRHRQAR